MANAKDVTYFEAKIATTTQISREIDAALTAKAAGRCGEAADKWRGVAALAEQIGRTGLADLAEESAGACEALAVLAAEPALQPHAE